MLIDSKYYIKEVLSEEECCTTYLIWHIQWELYLTLKVSRSLNHPTIRATLMKEAIEWIELGVHPNIVSAYFIKDSDDNEILFFQEYIQHKKLNEVKEKISSSFLEILKLALEVSNGLLYLHKENVIYKNLRTDNIIIDKYSRIKLNNIRWDCWEELEMLTKGLKSTFYANKLDDKKIRDKAIIRLSYTPPEYLLEKNYKSNILWDIYSFGILLYELLVGELPFSSIEEDIEDLFLYFKKFFQKPENEVKINLEKIKEDIKGDVPNKFLELVNRCLKKDQTKRPQSFKEIIKFLKETYKELTKREYIFEEWSENTLLALSLNNRALGCIDRGELNEAEKILKEVVHVDRNNIHAYLNLNLLRLHKKEIKYKEFLNNIEKFKLLNDAKVYICEGKCALEYGNEVQTALENLEKGNIKEDRCLDTLKADLYYRLGFYQKAREIYKSYINREESQELWYKLGASALALKLNKEAQKIWEQGLKKELPLWDLVVGYSMLLAIQGKWGLARQTLDRALNRSKKYIKKDIPKSCWSQVRKFYLKGKSIIHIAISSDKKYIVAHTNDGEMHIWEWPSGEKRDEVKIETDLTKTDVSKADSTTTKLFRRLVASELRDIVIDSEGKIGVTIHGDQKVRVWDLKKNEILYEFRGHTDVVTSISITGDGEIAISGSMDKTIRIWNIKKGKCIGILEGHKDCVSCVAISEDGTLAISSGWDKIIKIWDIGQKKEIGELKGVKKDINILCISKDGKLAIAGDSENVLRIWNIENKELVSELICHSDYITSLSLSYDNHLLVSSGKDGYICIYEDISKRPCPLWVYSNYFIGSLPLQEKEKIEKSKKLRLAIKKDIENKNFEKAYKNYHKLISFNKPYIDISNKLISPFILKNIKRKNIKNIKTISIFIHDSPVNSFVTFEKNTEYFVSISEDGVLKRWYIDECTSDVFWKKKSFGVIKLSYCEDKKYFCFTGKDGILHKWVPGYDKWYFLEGEPGPMRCLKLFFEGERAISGNLEGILQIWDLNKNSLLYTWNGHKGMITDVDIDEKENIALTSSLDGTVKVWDINKRRCILTTQNLYKPLLCIKTYEKEGRKYFITGGLDGAVREWEIDDDECREEIKVHKYSITCMDFYKDKNLLILGFQDGMIKIFDIIKKKIVLEFKAHRKKITQVEVILNGEWLFSSSEDNIIKLWKIIWE